MSDPRWIPQAIDKALEGIATSQAPFGAVIVRGDQLICATHNSVWTDTDPTVHAEINATRQAARLLATIGLHGCEMYATCEPCPMCLSAIHCAKLDRVIYGADIADDTAVGFSELTVPARELVTIACSPLRVEGGLLADQCRALFRRWRETPGARSY